MIHTNTDRCRFLKDFVAELSILRHTLKQETSTEIHAVILPHMAEKRKSFFSDFDFFLAYVKI